MKLFLLAIYLNFLPYIEPLYGQNSNNGFVLEYEMQFNIPGLVSFNNSIQRYEYVYYNGLSKFRYIGERKQDPTIKGRFKPGGLSQTTTYRDFTHRYQYRQHDVQQDWIARDTMVFDKKWKVSFDEDKDILGYHCNKATSDTGEVVWFCKEIPVPDGPYNYGGLPGLILHVEGDNYNIIATKIDRDIAIQPIALPVSNQYMTEAEFQGKIKP